MVWVEDIVLHTCCGDVVFAGTEAPKNGVAIDDV